MFMVYADLEFIMLRDSSEIYSKFCHEMANRRHFPISLEFSWFSTEIFCDPGS